MTTINKEISIVTALWGDWHIEQFVSYVLPALSHPSNLPALAARAQCVWRIHTRADDEARLNSIVEPLRHCMRVHVTTNGGQAGKHYRDAWHHEHEAGANGGTIVMFLPPDVVWSIGSFTHIANLIEVGVRNIYTAHPRSRPSELYAEPRSAADLMRQVVADQHPLNKSHEYESRHFTRHPEMIIWQVKGAKVVRLFAREMFVCDPQEVNFNPSNLPDAIGMGPHMVTLSDDAFGVSLAPELHDECNYAGRERMCSAEFVANWLKEYNSPANRWIASQAVVWRHGDVDAEELAQMIADSGHYADDVFRHAAA